MKIKQGGTLFRVICDLRSAFCNLILIEFPLPFLTTQIFLNQKQKKKKNTDIFLFRVSTLRQNLISLLRNNSLQCKSINIYYKPDIYVIHMQFSLKVQIVQILGFMGHMVSVMTIQLCCYSTKAPTDNMQTYRHGCAPMKLKNKTQHNKTVGRPDVASETQFADSCSR